jgi:DNA modification methylase/superfamily II DNA or RNA helicase
VDYQTFLSHKQRVAFELGYKVDDSSINPILFPFQRDVVKWAVSKGRAAIFLDTGLGKTFIQLEWARLMGKVTLIVAPLSVARQTIREAKKINIDVKYVRNMDEIGDCLTNIFITNYELIEHFDMDTFGAIVLDESSILKAISGKTRQLLTDKCQSIQYRLCCTATPAPNDYTEIGNHAEFLGICSTQEMLGQFFINANKEHTFIMDGKAYHKKGSNAAGTEWRLKHHAEQPFFRWLASWAITMIKPSDLGYDDDGFILPELYITPMFVNATYTPEDQLFFTNLHGIEDRTKVRRITLQKRLEAALELLSKEDNNEQWIIWCGLDDESKALRDAIPNAIEVKGSDDPEYKAKAFEDFQDGKYNILITKAKIGGYGMNFQNAHNMIFFGMNDSWELYYQAIRREWRYRQENPVYVYIILSELEDAIYKNVMRKDAMAKRLRTKLIEHILDYERLELSMNNNIYQEYKEDTITGVHFTAMLGDSGKRLSEIKDNTIDMSVYSPPFADLFVYSASERDLGNSKNHDEFFEHYKYIIAEMLRVTKPGRISCVHTSDIPAMAQRDGYIGVKDFPGDVIRAHIEAGWIFAGRAFVQKNPQAQAIRTKSKALLFVQLRKDSSDSRPALVDQVLIFTKPGENAIPILPVENGDLDNEKWIEWANGIWLGISESDTLQFTTARDTGDEKHICPLQLGTIERCIKLYSNPGETILTPFMGIGSEAYQAIRFGRKGIGIELKESYYHTAVNNLKRAESTYHQDLFTWQESHEKNILI